MKKLLLTIACVVTLGAAVFSQNVGIGTNDPKSKLDINGGLSLREGPVLTLANGGASGGVNDNIALPDITTGVKAGFYRIAGPTASFSIFGIQPATGADGQVVTLVNTTSNVMTIKNNASSVAANSFKTLTGSDMVSVAGNSSITIQYNKTDGRWYVTGSQNYVVTTGSISTGDITTTNTAINMTNNTGRLVGTAAMTIDVATNALAQKGLVPGPTGGNANQVWGTDGSGNPAWQKVGNSQLTNNSVTVSPGTGMSGGGTVALGGTITLTNSGDTDPSNDITNTTSAGGDLSGTYPNPGVAKIKGVAVSATAPTSNQVLKYNSGTSQWEPGTDVNSGGTVTSIATNNGITGGTITGTGTVGLTGNALAMHNLTSGMVAITGAGTAAGRTITGTTKQIDVTNGNGVSGDPTIGISSTYTAESKANTNMTGGGTITYSSGFDLSWSNRFIVISNGSGSHFGTSGYFDISMPANGTVIPGLGGASPQTVAGGVINIPAWRALYYILPIGSGNGSIAANYVLAAYTSAMVVPETWVLIALRNGDDNILKLGTGVMLLPGQTYGASSANVLGTGTANYIPKFTSANAVGNSVMYESGSNVGIGTTTVTEKVNIAGNAFFTGSRAEIYAADRNHMIVMRGDQAGTAANENCYYQYGGTLAAALGHRFFTGGAVASQTEKMRISDDGIYMAGPVGVGTSAPVSGTKLQVRSGKTYLNKNGNDPSGSYVDADLVLGDDVTNRSGFTGGTGSNLLLQSVDKSAITALDQGQDLGQISYQNLKWTIGEDIGWGTQNIRFPKYTNGFHVGDGSGNLTTPRSMAVSGNGIGVSNGDGVSGNPTFSLNYGSNLNNAAGGGGWPVGNFGQFESHGTYTDFNTVPNYWGWNYVQGSTNGPTNQSTQWYRENLSLGSNYAGRSGGYSLELAYPREYTNNAGVWMRSVEGGTINGWKRITGGDIAYVVDRGLRTFGSTSGGGSGAVTISASTGNLAVVTGDIIHISSSFQFAFTGGSGNDDMFAILQITGCATTSQQNSWYQQNWDNDRNELQPQSEEWIYVSPCTGNLQFYMQINAEANADDGYETGDLVLVATRH